MSRSPCSASNIINILPMREIKSPLPCKLSPAVGSQLDYKTAPCSLSPYNQCKSLQVPSPSPFHLSPGTNSFLRRKSLPSSVDSPQRLLFVSKIKTSLKTSNRLGRGRFGQVVLAKYKDEYIAVKIVKRASKFQSINERNGQNLSHPNVVKILKIDQIDSEIIILMEPWGSLNLQQLLSVSLKIPWDDVSSYSKQLASALHYCHSNGVLHLDVKPANIMVNSQRWIKLGDFGNSITTQQLGGGPIQRVGTVSYCAPEILRGEEPSWHSDVYSYGVTLWQLEHNQVPFSDLSWPTIVYLVVAKDERPALSGSLTPIEMRLADLYQKCWSPRLKERPDMFKIIHTLDNL